MTDTRSIEDRLRIHPPLDMEELDAFTTEIWRRMPLDASQHILDMNAAKLATMNAMRVSMSLKWLETSSEKTGKQLTRWTMWLAFGTFFLGAVEIWATLQKHG